MVASAFYLRIRGRISGPFDVSTLQKLVHRGELSRIHEISSDRSTWSTAGHFEDLFPASPALMVPTSEVAEAGNDTESAKRQPIEASATALYHYTQRGFTVGPVSLTILKTLAENGTLLPDDLVWREHSETGSPAAQFPALAPLFARPSAVTPPNQPTENHQPDGNSSITTVTSRDVLARRTGIAAGALVLVLINLPWFVWGSKAVWWWNLYAIPKETSWALCVTFQVLAAAALCVVGPLTNGGARGAVYLSLTLAAWIFLAVVTLTGGSSANDVARLIVPIALSLLLGTCFFRNTSPQSVAGRTFVGIFSGISTFGSLVGIVNLLQGAREVSSIPDGVFFGGILVLIGMLAGLAAGIMGLVGLKPMFTRSLNQLTEIAAISSLVLPGLGIFVAAVSAGSLIAAHPTGRVLGDLVVVETAARVLLILYAFLAVAAVGMRELLIATRGTASRE